MKLEDQPAARIPGLFLAFVIIDIVAFEFDDSAWAHDCVCFAGLRMVFCQGPDANCLLEMKGTK